MKTLLMQMGDSAEAKDYCASSPALSWLPVNLPHPRQTPHLCRPRHLRGAAYVGLAI
ncbi:MAG: hypothetical protein HZB18_12385 [Chloroflexi bacterium]|nr:hypothetical protein [Chloroflexota bacterium]